MLKQISLAKVDLNLLVLFHAVMEEQQVARAAGRLNLTPSAVSHSLGRLRHLFNDPLFLRTPKGMVPTERALELREPIGDIIARTRSVVASALPFDALTTSRRFIIGAPDAIMASVTVSISERLKKHAPRAAMSLIHLMPGIATGNSEHPWQNCLQKLEEREVDLAVLPVSSVPARFEMRRLYDEDFVVAMRKGHRFARAPTLSAFCKAEHLLVSLDGDPRGFIDKLLVRRGLKRRVALTVPTFMMALPHLGSSDMIAALPRRLVEKYAAHFALEMAELPLKRGSDAVQVITTKAAMMDSGVAWLMKLIVGKIDSRSHD
jgi:DNA-binding transcriptional LysR family regulator